MNESEKAFIISKIVSLNEVMSWNPMLTGYLKQSNVLNTLEMEELESISSLPRRKWELLNILAKKVNGYKLLVDALRGSNQSGAVALLEKYQDQACTTSVTTTNTAKRWSLNFGDVDVKNMVLQKVRHSLISKMPSEDINARIILQLGGLNVFEASECDQILYGVGEFCNQQKRMTQLFRIISTLSSSEIVLCFEKLCDLENLPKYSERFREVFQTAYPGALTSC